MRWDNWRGSMDGRPTLWVKHILCRLGCHIDLHKMVDIDGAGCFHTHPAWAIRLILCGGYEDETETGERKWWLPGQIGLVAPGLSHRVSALRHRESFSLWIRFRKVAAVHLRGPGWDDMDQTFRVQGTILGDRNAPR